jgi:hypothetical protein
MPEMVPEVVEQKFVFPIHYRDELLAWATYALEPDPGHSGGVVHSLYYDTPDLELYSQKRNSEFLKYKVRLRWYDEAGALPPDARVPCFLEVKRKIGAARRKRRTTADLPAAVLAGSPFDSPEVSALAGVALEIGFAAQGPLVPMALIRYHRMRFVDPATGARIALDGEIGCQAVNRAFLPAEAPIVLDTGVLEIKGTARHLPPSLEPVAFLLTKSSFSKYAQCLEHLLHPAGVRI